MDEPPGSSTPQGKVKGKGKAKEVAPSGPDGSVIKSPPKAPASSRPLSPVPLSPLSPIVHQHTARSPMMSPVRAHYKDKLITLMTPEERANVDAKTLKLLHRYYTTDSPERLQQLAYCLDPKLAPFGFQDNQDRRQNFTEHKDCRVRAETDIAYDYHYRDDTEFTDTGFGVIARAQSPKPDAEPEEPATRTEQDEPQVLTASDAEIEFFDNYMTLSEAARLHPELDFDPYEGWQRGRRTTDSDS